MINHAFSCFYGYATPSAAGVYVPLTAPVNYGDVLRSGLAGLRGATSVSAEAFAIRALKVIEASTYASELTKKDARLTYASVDLGVSEEDSAAFLNAVVGLPGAVISLATSYEDTSKTFSTSRILTERAAAVLVGILRKVNELNGY